MKKLAKFLIASPENNFHPPILSSKAFLIYGLILLILRLLLGALPSQGLAVDSNILLDIINQERSNRNLPVLFTHPQLLVAAAEKSQDMIDRDYFAHIDPDGKYVWGRIEKAGYKPYKILGENLAIDFATSEGMVKAWIDSPTHRANLLHQDFVDQGLEALYGDYQGRYTNLTASLFGALAVSQKPRPIVSPSQPKAPEIAPSPLPLTVPTTSSTTSPTTAQKPSSREPLERSIAQPVTGVEIQSQKFVGKLDTATSVSRIIFTLFGILLLIILSFDSIVIYRHEKEILRSHPSYHLFGFILIVLVSILIWWW